jgi:hypothetical protein
MIFDGAGFVPYAGEAVEQRDRIREVSTAALRSKLHMLEPQARLEARLGAR